MAAVQAGEASADKGVVSAALLVALAQPKEREKLHRLEQELTRLVSNPSVDRLDMQPMSAHNRVLVAGVAAHFGLRFVVVPADETAPAAAPHEERFLPVWLGKCEETTMPTERLAAPILKQEKVQLMRRAGGGANGKSAKAPEQLSAAEEQARHKHKEDAYAAARQRIFGGAAQGGEGVVGGDAPAPAPAADRALPAPAEHSAEGSTATAAAPSGQPNPHNPTRSVNKSEAQRAHDMMDPDFSRRSVRWAAAPSLPPQVPMQCPGGAGYGGYGDVAAQLHRHSYLGAGAAQSAPRYSQCSPGWGMQMPQMPSQPNAPSLGVGMAMSLGGAVPMGPMAMAGQMPLYARPAGQMPLGAGAVQGHCAYGAYCAPTVGMAPPPQPRLPGADCSSIAAPAATSALLHPALAPAAAGVYAQQQAYAAPAAGVYAQQQQAYAAMLAALPEANGFYQTPSIDPAGGHAAPHPYLPAAAQPGAWTQNGA